MALVNLFIVGTFNRKLQEPNVEMAFIFPILMKRDIFLSHPVITPVTEIRYENRDHSHTDTDSPVKPIALFFCHGLKTHVQ